MRLPKHGIFASVQLPKKTKRWLKDDIISFSYSRPCEVDPLTEIGHICPCSTPHEDDALIETWCIAISLRSRSTWYIFHSEIET